MHEVGQGMSIFSSRGSTSSFCQHHVLSKPSTLPTPYKMALLLLLSPHLNFFLDPLLGLLVFFIPVLYIKFYYHT
jgi:hypothetical protein